MIYECEQCETALPSGALACPKCGEVFEDAVPQDAVVRKSGWKPKTEQHFTIPAAPPVDTIATEPYPDYILPDEPRKTNTSKAPHANQHSSYWTFTALGLLLWPVGVIVGIVFLTKPTLLERKLGEHTIVMSILGFVLGVVLSVLMFGTHNALPSSASSDPVSVPISSSAATPESVESNTASDSTNTDDNATLSDETELEKGSENFSKEYGFVKVNGEVTNISSQSIKNVEAETTFYDDSGNVIKTTSALLELNPILPGQTSPYQTMDTDNPEIKREKTSFSVMMGGSVPYRDKAKGSSSSSDSDDLDKPITNFRSRMNLPQNDFFSKYVLVSEPGDDYGILNLTMTADFASLSQAKKHDTEYHLWHLWHHVSGHVGDTVYFDDTHNKSIGSMENGKFTEAN